ncbi:putative quinol monooxygenase [Rhodohalobacter sp. 8-1]|uniref:putative quinol monooxygenase n=1 Tax=Rhodohalobacter sp. 8-1 TaxID=3131972 RepID=UPI0030ED1F57
MTVKKGLLARLEAKPGKEDEVEEFLKSALPLAEAEDMTIDWFAFKIDDSTFGIYDTFEGEEGQKAHLEGEIASALIAKADDLLASEPVIEKVDVLASK